ncbi:MAG: ABC transporter ATP-binding protein [Chloroflexi bacterium]|jgi:ABC-2 type transport system ATP-binding protein|nr:ABC transporter ATP-binding protein [Chloroflexota bacterium]
MSSKTETVIAVINLFKAYSDIKAVDGISIDVKMGEVFGMLGPNGAGKTTTVEIIEGQRAPDSGSVTVLGMDALKDVRAVKEHIGVQPQSPALFPTLNVQEIIDFFRSLYKKTIPTQEVIELVSLQESRNVLVKNLSGGQQQRLSVALAFINDPDIIFLDEPTTGLDPQARRTMWEVIETFRKMGKTIFLTTHYMEEAERLCDRVAIMDHGNIIALGRPQQMIEDHFKESAIQFKMSDYPGQKAMASLTGVTKVVKEEEEEIILYTDNVPSTISSLLDLASERSAELSDLFVRQATLEDVFLKLTGKRIRD